LVLKAFKAQIILIIVLEPIARKQKSLVIGLAKQQPNASSICLSA
jgi:hypothetical protein